MNTSYLGIQYFKKRPPIFISIHCRVDLLRDLLNAMLKNNILLYLTFGATNLDGQYQKSMPKCKWANHRKPVRINIFRNHAISWPTLQRFSIRKKASTKKKQQIQYIRKLFSLSGGEKRRALEKNICQLWWGVWVWFYVLSATHKSDD